jgi:hypothetical protein
MARVLWQHTDSGQYIEIGKLGSCGYFIEASFLTKDDVAISCEVESAKMRELYEALRDIFEEVAK